ncbi:hypothetical protein M8818_000101 [Zalaria obscura]|uniref:Uncharacterized protein n=1 Tax=Zalaria obscura TaxID=2024903 RepID=A0ACC3SP86_9PEZI
MSGWRGFIPRGNGCVPDYVDSWSLARAELMNLERKDSLHAAAPSLEPASFTHPTPSTPRQAGSIFGSEPQAKNECVTFTVVSMLVPLSRPIHFRHLWP